MAAINADSPVDDLGMTKRSTNALKADNIRTIRQLIALSECELDKTPNLGSKSIREVKYALSEHGLMLAGGNAKPKKKNFYVCAYPEHHEAIKAYAAQLEASNGSS